MDDIEELRFALVEKEDSDIEESNITELTGLELSEVKFDVHGYRYGTSGKVEEVHSSTITVVTNAESEEF